MFKTNTSDDENQGGQNQNKEQDDLELNIDASDEIEAESGGIEDDKEAKPQTPLGLNQRRSHLEASAEEEKK